ncbi:MAG TPA: hypothetical protein VIY48_05215, partial [Candidatus Paceibacterota bacterium]
MAARHIEIAAEQGAKAGFNAWVEQMERSGLPAVQDKLAEVRAQGNKKAQFDFYCAKFGQAIDKIRHKGNGVSEPEPVQVGGDVEALMAQIAALGSQVQALVKGESGVQVVADESDEDIPDDVDFSTTTTRRTTRTT